MPLSAVEQHRLKQIKPGARVTPRASAPAAVLAAAAAVLRPGELGFVEALEDDGVQYLALVRPATGGQVGAAAAAAATHHTWLLRQSRQSCSRHRRRCLP